MGAAMTETDIPATSLVERLNTTASKMIGLNPLRRGRPQTTQELLREAAAEIERLRAALREIRDTDHQSYDLVGQGQYGYGVADGHRCAAKIAEDALAEDIPAVAPEKSPRVKE